LDYLIQNDDKKFVQVVYPEPDDIDNLEDNDNNNIVNYDFRNINNNDELNFNNSKNKSNMRQNTSDQIDYVDNKIGKFEKLIGGNETNSSKYNTPKGFSAPKYNISKDSMDV
jgi:hypothetical protein